jgi:RimJ/RimL family protein N-acetyltransferase
MNAPSLTGQLVRLSMIESEEDFLQWAAWYRDGEYQRLLDTDPAALYTPAQIKTWLETKSGSFTLFGIRKLPEDRLIGFVDLSDFDWRVRSAWTGIGIGERDSWGKGYGTEAMRLLLQYAFASLNLNRVNLTVFSYNERAYRSYRKCGFCEEGRVRQLINRYDQRWDMVYMGILREEWQGT